MAHIVVKYCDSSKDVYFGDSAFGTGALYLAVLQKVRENKALGYTIKSAIGVDVNQHMALEAMRKYSGWGLTIVWTDSLLPMIDSYLGDKRNIMLVSLPYSRSS